MDTMLDIKEAAVFLGIGEERLNEFVDNRLIPAYMVAGKFLRFKKSELEALKDLLRRDTSGDERIFNKVFSEVRGLEKLREFLRANDIYFIIGVAILLLLVFMFFNLSK